MKKEEINISILEAERFIRIAKDCLQARSVSHSYGEHTFYESAPKESGALRRASMDLTRQLAKMRKP